jgi:tRNA nucleotidyltransferase (CCA-adding enzyme)
MTNEHIYDRLIEHLGSGAKYLEQIGKIADRRGVDAALVGGSIRDFLIGRTSPDMDFLVTGRGLSFARSLARSMRCHLEIFPPFDSAKIYLHNGQVLDIAGARLEKVSAPAAQPKVIGPASIEQDMKRRDFTINAMAIMVAPTKAGMLVDPFGGKEDIENKIIRPLHDSSFTDDPTRIMRAVRFAHRLGFEIDPRALAQAKKAIPLMSKLRPGRWVKELRAAFSEPQTQLILQQLEDLGALQMLHPSIRIPTEEEIEKAGQDGFRILATLIRNRRIRQQVAVRLHLREIENNLERQRKMQLQRTNRHYSQKRRSRPRGKSRGGNR